jgi:hypothetical protein
MCSDAVYRAAAVALAAAFLISGSACGDDDANGESADSGVQPASSNGGDGAGPGNGGHSGASSGHVDGGPGASGAGGGAGDGTGDGGAGMDDAGPDGGGMMFPGLMCTEDPPAVPLVCGGTECPMPTAGGFNRCRVPCCVEDAGDQVCGTRNTAMGFETECAAPPVTDTSCPDVAFMGRTLPGCCAPSHLCGIVSSISNSCITTSRFIDLPENPMSCDTGDPGTGEGDAGAEDAGFEDDAGAH